jgi:hypothetical protein
MGESGLSGRSNVLRFRVSEAHYFVDFVNYVHSVHLAATPLRRFALSPFRPFALSPLRSPYPLKIAE